MLVFIYVTLVLGLSLLLGRVERLLSRSEWTA